jgi:hypothetical protein
MNLAEQIEALKTRGFSQERAEVILLMQEASIVLFQAWPESFVLYGGANLILFHNSVRHSGDLDLLLRSGEMPSAPAITKVLIEGLDRLSGLLNFGKLEARVFGPADQAMTKIAIIAPGNRTLFTVDLGGIGSVIQSGIEEHTIQAIALSKPAIIKSVSRDHLLLQKAEAFLWRKFVKARDAYDIMLLLGAGATLGHTLTQHLDDRLRGEFDEESIRERIDSITEKLCRAELKEVLPEEIYRPLERMGFQALRDALSKLFESWL